MSADLVCAELPEDDAGSRCPECMPFIAGLLDRRGDKRIATSGALKRHKAEISSSKQVVQVDGLWEWEGGEQKQAWWSF